MKNRNNISTDAVIRTACNSRREDPCTRRDDTRSTTEDTRTTREDTSSTRENTRTTRSDIITDIETRSACNEPGESILKSITKGDNVKSGRTIRVEGQRHNVLATVSIDTSKMCNPTTLLHLSGYIKGNRELNEIDEDDRPKLFLVKKMGCQKCRRRECDDDNEILADYTIPFDKFYDSDDHYDKFRVEHVFAHHFTDAVGAKTCVSSVCDRDRAGVATYYLTFKDADEECNKIRPSFEDVHLSALAVENKLF